MKSVTNGTAAHPWAGDMLVVREGLRDDPWEVKDAVMEEDIPVMTRYWREYGKEPHSTGLTFGTFEFDPSSPTGFKIFPLE